MSVVNRYKFVGKDNDTTGNALDVFGTGNPKVNETYIVKSILVTSDRDWETHLRHYL